MIANLKEENIKKYSCIIIGLRSTPNINIKFMDCAFIISLLFIHLQIQFQRYMKCYNMEDNYERNIFCILGCSKDFNINISYSSLRHAFGIKLLFIYFYIFYNKDIVLFKDNI